MKLNAVGAVWHSNAKQKYHQQHNSYHYQENAKMPFSPGVSITNVLLSILLGTIFLSAPPVVSPGNTKTSSSSELPNGSS